MTATRVKRTKLADFRCPYHTLGGCSLDCWIGTAQRCEIRPIYEQAIADARCARLLGIFERHMIRIPLSADMILARWVRFRIMFREALRKAGLQ